MKHKKDDGGPAVSIPSAWPTDDDRSLRDWFAGQALALLSDENYLPEEAAKMAYKVADSMLKEGERND